MRSPGLRGLGDLLTVPAALHGAHAKERRADRSRGGGEDRAADECDVVAAGERRGLTLTRVQERSGS